MTGKERAALRKKAHSLDPVINIGKEGVTGALCGSVSQALKARELIKVCVLKNNPDDIRQTALVLSERTRSELIQVMGRKITLYKYNPDKHKNK